MNQWFERLTEQVALAHDEAAVRATLEKLSQEAGFGAYAYLSLQAETHTAISNYDVEWQQRYLERAYALIDPVVRNARDKLEAFASLNGPAWYGLQPNVERITLVKRDAPVEFPARIETGAGPVTVFDTIFKSHWDVEA